MKLSTIKKVLEKLDGFEYHEELNPALWNGFEIKPEIRVKLLDIAKAFFDFLEVDWAIVKDVVLTGSSANYNYTKYSDIDVHLVIDYQSVHKDCPIVGGYLHSKKTIFNKNNDIFINGMPVELYAEDVDSPAKSSGIFSLAKNEWIEKPEHKKINIDDQAVITKYEYLKNAIEASLNLKNDSDEVEDLLKKVYNMRKAGLADGGEFSVENLVFKMLRNNKYIGKLREFSAEKTSKNLSL